MTSSEIAQLKNAQEVSMSEHTMQSADVDKDCPHHQATIETSTHDCCDNEGTVLLDGDCSGQCGDCEKGASALVNSSLPPSYMAPEMRLGLSPTFNNPPQQQAIIPPIQ